MGLKSCVRDDVLAKVRGQAGYADDLHFEDLLHMKMVRSPHAHARVIDIDDSQARALPGVIGVYTARDLPIKPSGPDRPVLAWDTVRYIGDGVALVAAETELVAEEAARLVKVKYQVLQGIFDPEVSLHEEAKPIHGESNVVSHWRIDRGDVDKAFVLSDVILDREYSTHAVYHGHMETEVAVAQPTATGLTIFCPSKMPTIVRNAVAFILGLKQNQVRMIQPVIGGSFGAKGPDAIILAARVGLVALLTGRACKGIYSRQESIIEGTKRHPFRMKYKVGATRDGRINAMDICILADAGAYRNETPRVTARAVVEAAGPYVVPNLKVDVKGVYTNQVNSDAVRGFGSPQVDFASELLISELAEVLGIDSFKIRRINGFKEGSLSATGQKMTAVGLDDCLDALEKYLDNNSGIKEMMNENQIGKRRGIGIACMFRGESKGAAAVDTAGVNIQVQPDASIVVYSGLAEVGQGGYTILKCVIAKVLGIGEERIVVSPYDSCYCPDGGPTVASRGTVTSGNAARLAAEAIREKLSKVAVAKLSVPLESLVFKEGRIFDRGNPTLGLSFENAVHAVYEAGDHAYGYGWWSAPETTWNYETGDVSECAPYFSYVYGANAAAVEVDLVSGKVDVLKIVAAHDVGFALNPAEVKNQIMGGVGMGIGYALTEDLDIEEGRIRNDNYDCYLLPTSLDIQEVVPLIVERAGPEGPLGAKGLGEPATCIVAPAILNAIANAIGCRLYDLPANLERVRSGIEAAKELSQIDLSLNRREDCPDISKVSIEGNEREVRI